MTGFLVTRLIWTCPSFILCKLDQSIGTNWYSNTLVKRCTTEIVRSVDSVRRFRVDIIVFVVHELWKLAKMDIFWLLIMKIDKNWWFYKHHPCFTFHNIIDCISYGGENKFRSLRSPNENCKQRVKAIIYSIIPYFISFLSQFHID